MANYYSKKEKSIPKRKIDKVKNYLYNDYNVDIIETPELNSSYYYPKDNIIELNKSDTLEIKLYSLLHEAGHMILRKNKNCKFSFFYPTIKCNIEPEHYLGSKSGCVETLSEEINAWYVGYNLSKTLNIKISWNKYAKFMNNCIWQYIKGLYNYQKFEGTSND